ncbi:hypothetical protein [Arthrobacter sp. H5]|uniref:hypothetical protein n=1 Tax=Arthrobacter sp. H5 TaxID=1267973 RepID=UPI00048831B6|nr:hypothetical protein [Arthrobacter sp. H5]
MHSSQPEQKLLVSFTSEQWNGRPAKGGCSMLIGGVIAGYILAVILMIFIPPLRGGVPATVFAIIIGVLITWAGVGGEASKQKAFFRDLLDSLNGTILGVTGNSSDQLTASSLRALIEGGRTRPLLVNGVPGLELRAQRTKTAAPRKTVQVKGKPAQHQPEPIVTTRIFIVMTPPDLGISSFDRLLEAGG